MDIASFSPRNLGTTHTYAELPDLWLQAALAECGGRVRGLTLARSEVVVRELVTHLKPKSTLTCIS